MLKRLLIACPTALQTVYSAPSRDFEVFNGQNYLRLLIPRSQYTAVHTYKSGSPEYTRSFISPVSAVRAYISELEIKVSDERSHLFYLMRQLAANSISSDFQTQTAIQMLDFVLPEPSDVQSAITAGTEACTVRSGLLKEVKPAGGLVSNNMGLTWLGGGFSFKFEEQAMRIGG